MMITFVVPTDGNIIKEIKHDDHFCRSHGRQHAMTISKYCINIPEQSLNIKIS